MQISRSDYGSRLRIELVDVVLRRRNVHILHTVRSCEDKRLREDLFGTDAFEVPWQLSFEDLTKVQTPYDGWVHVVISLITMAHVTPSPGVRVC